MNKWEEIENNKALFDKCTETKLMEDGTVEIHCNRGIWCAYGKDRQKVEREARGYWSHYYLDGDYGEVA